MRKEEMQEILLLRNSFLVTVVHSAVKWGNQGKLGQNAKCKMAFSIILSRKADCDVLLTADLPAEAPACPACPRSLGPIPLPRLISPTHFCFHGNLVVVRVCLVPYSLSRRVAEQAPLFGVRPRSLV